MGQSGELKQWSLFSFPKISAFFTNCYCWYYL